MLSRRALVSGGSAAALSTVLPAAVLAGALDQAADAATPAAAPADPELAAFFEAQFERTLARSPQFAAQIGGPLTKAQKSSWDNPSAAFEEETIRLNEAAALEMQQRFGARPLNPTDALSVRLYAKQVRRARAAFAFNNHSYPFNQMFGAQSGVPTFLANTHRVASVEDAEAYVARLEGIEGYLGTIIEESDAAAARGLGPPRFVYDYVLSDCRNLLAGAPFTEGASTPSPMWTDFRTKVEALEADAGIKQRLLAAGEAALKQKAGPTYQRMVASMEAQQANARTTDGVWALPDGEAYYAERLANQTTTSLTAQEIHQLGLDAVARIHGEMAAIMRQVGYTGARDQFFDYLETDPRFFVSDDAEGRARYIREATALIDAMRVQIPDVFNVMPRAPMVVRAVEPFRERSAGLAFYQRPSADGTRPGVYYINTFNVKAIPTYQMEALAYHEGIPGHHMQIAIMQELPGLPRFRRFASNFTAYSEGWALYTEFLPKEMGFYQDPYSDFGRLVLELRRAIRLVVDTGLHALRWPRQQAIDYILANQPGDEPSARRDIDRYIVMPGQATAYLIGQMEILKLREAARARLGTRFDLRHFHDIVLTNGSVPLDILGELVGAWA